MERSLLLGAAALGVVGWLVSALLARSERDSSAWRAIAPAFRWTALALPVLVFLATLPSGAPFRSGHGFGNGFLIGSVAALLAAFAVAGLRQSERPVVNSAVVLAPLWIVVPAVAVPLLFMRSVLMDALLGVAIGFLCIVATIFQGIRHETGTGDESRNTGLALLSGAGFAVATAMAAGLGAYRGGEIVQSSRFATAALLSATAVPLAVWIGSLPALLLLAPFRKLPGAAAVSSRGSDVLRTESRRAAAANLFKWVVGAAVVLIADHLIAARLLDEMHAFYIPVVGIALGLLAWWLAADEAAVNTDGTAYRRPIAILAALGAAMISFNWMLGFGIALMCLSLWAPLGWSLCANSAPERGRPEETANSATMIGHTLWSVASFTVILTIYRFLSTRFQTELRGVSLTDHYALFGFMAGAAIPGVLAGVASVNSRPTPRLLRLVAAGILALALPALILILWKAKSALALLAGASLAAAGFNWLTPGRREARAGFAQLFSPLMALAVCLALAQWTPYALDVASLTRDQKISVLKWILGGIAALLVAVDLGQRWQQARNRRTEAAGKPGMEAVR